MPLPQDTVNTAMGAVTSPPWQRPPAASLTGLMSNSTMLPKLLGYGSALPASMRNLPMVMTPGANGAMLESWGKGEEGTPDYPRPGGLPMNQDSVQVFNPDTITPKNVLADVVGHFMADPQSENYDPVLGGMYDQYVKSLDPRMMQQRYEYARQNFGEERPYEQWLHASGAPAVFRGYTFDQWPRDFNEQINTPEQIQMLDEIKRYLGI